MRTDERRTDRKHIPLRGRNLRRGAIAAGAFALVGATAVVYSSNASAADVGATFSSDGGGGAAHVATYTVKNSGTKALNGWKLEFDLPSGASMGAFWNGVASVSGRHVSVRNREFNGNLAPGASTEFGWVQYGAGEPANCRINGSSCGGAAAPAPKPKPTKPAPKPKPNPKPTKPNPPPPPNPKPNPSGFDGFTPYIDTSLNGGTDFDGVAKASGAKFLNLAFVVSGGACTPTWGGAAGIDDPVRTQKIAALRKLGGDVRVSFGGASGQELALTCTSVDQLVAAYQKVIDTYKLTHVDFDIEGGATGQVDSVKRRNQAIKQLQAKNKGLAVSYTLPVLPTGLLADSVALVQDAAKAGVDIEAVNVMAMDYGPGADGGKPMGDLAIAAANATANQLKDVLGGSQAAALRKIAVTPMIGVNDVASEVFKQADASKVVAFAKQSKLAWLAFWSLGRDNGTCAGAGAAQAACSSVAQQQFEFARIFGGFQG